MVDCRAVAIAVAVVLQLLGIVADWSHHLHSNIGEHQFVGAFIGSTMSPSLNIISNIPKKRVKS